MFFLSSSFFLLIPVRKAPIRCSIAVHRELHYITRLLDVIRPLEVELYWLRQVSETKCGSGDGYFHLVSFDVIFDSSPCLPAPASGAFFEHIRILRAREMAALVAVQDQRRAYSKRILQGLYDKRHLQSLVHI